MRDKFKLVIRSVNEWESVGGFVTDGGKVESAEVENVVEEAGLFARNVFDAGEFDDVGGFNEEGVLSVVDDAFVSDEEFVSEINLGAEETGEDENGVKSAEEKPEIDH